MADADPRSRNAVATRTAAWLWSFGGVLVLVASVVRPSVVDDAVVLSVLGAGAVLVGLAHHGLARAGGGPRGFLVATTHLGTVAITVAAVAAGGNDVAVAALYGFVLLMGALHLTVADQIGLAAGVGAGAVVLVATGTPPDPLVVVLAVVGGAAVVAGREHAALEASRRRVEAQERWRVALQATLGHDVRGPLATIDATLLLLQRHGGEVEVDVRDQVVAGARRQVARLQRLAADLLDVERVRDGRLRLDRGEVPAAHLLDGVVALVRGVRVEHVDPGLVLYVDPQRIEQVLHNLVSNATRYGAPPVQLDARRTPGGGAVLGVRDHGPGIPRDVAERIFDRFDADPEGVGLGMWIVRNLVDAHGGEVVLATVEKGARVEVRLPPDAVVHPGGDAGPAA